jgi:hypothetical protein
MHMTAEQLEIARNVEIRLAALESTAQANSSVLGQILALLTQEGAPGGDAPDPIEEVLNAILGLGVTLERMRADVVDAIGKVAAEKRDGRVR